VTIDASVLVGSIAVFDLSLSIVNVHHVSTLKQLAKKIFFPKALILLIIRKPLNKISPAVWPND
jgi:hypothetical protein